MLNDLLYPLAEYFQPFNLFKYISFRTIGAVITAILIAFIIGKPMINWLRARQGATFRREVSASPWSRRKPWSL